MRARSCMMALALAVPLACSGAGDDGAQGESSASALTGATVQLWVTSDPRHPFEKGADTSLGAPTGVAGSIGTLTIDESAENLRAEVDGFGAALTDASAGIMHESLSKSARTALLKDLMSPTEGLGLSMLRLPIAASDSTMDGSYSYDPDGPDPSMRRFSIEHDRAYILPELEEIVGSINPDVHIIATPWSPPGWMKGDSTSMIGGYLKAEYRKAYADYFVHFVRAYWEQPVHIPIYAVTPQNEPGQAADYPSMTMLPGAEATFIHEFLAPALKDANFGWVKIYGFDHNWGSSYPSGLLGDLSADHADDDLDGMAFHCYGGNESAAMTTLHQDARMAGKDIYLTECDRSEYDDGKLKSYAEGIEKLIYAMNNWSRSYLAWQLVLHPDGTPDQGHGCMGNGWHCVGVVSVTEAGDITKEWDYAYLGHASKYVACGATTVHMSAVGPVESVAFINPHRTRVLVAYNSSNEAARFEVVWQGQAFTSTIPARSAATMKWQGS
jgi:O-glycosyl hydrolase